jgi:outer membrane protein insertion porin family
LTKKSLSLICALFLFPFLASPRVFADEAKKIVLLPFQVHSKQDTVQLQKAIYEKLAGQLRSLKNTQFVDRDFVPAFSEGKNFDIAYGFATGRETGADFVITGTLTEYGDIISVDVRIMDVKKQFLLPVISAQGKGMDSLGSVALQLAADILKRVETEQRIARIEFKGNRRIEGPAINQVIKSTAGSVFSNTDLAQDIKAIYKMGYFTDVSTQTTDIPEGKVITFTLQEQGIVSSIKVTGNKKISKEDIEAVIVTKIKQILNREKIKADVGRIKELYDTKGYYNAEVMDVVEKEGEKDARIIYNIVENEQLYIEQISFTGNEAYTAKELSKLMTTDEKGFFYFISDSGLLKKEQLNQDIGKINAFYLNNGFIYALVGEPEIIHDKKGIYVKIPITEGKRYQIGKVSIAGDEIKLPRSELLDKLMINKKRYYDREAVMKDMDLIQQVCSDEGYAYADVVPRTAPQDKEQIVDVVYQVAKGNQVYFNRINIIGNTKTRDKVIRRLLTVVEGDLYSKTNIKNSYMAINRLRYFEEVDFQTEKGDDANSTNVNIRVREKPTGMFSIGAGYSALDNAIFSAQIAQQNLFGRGQSLSLRANIGGHSANYELSFIEPWLFDMPLWTKTDLWKMYRIYDTYRMDSFGAGFTFGYPIWEHISWYTGYKLSRDDVGQISDVASTYIKRQEGQITTSSLTVTLTRDTTDDIMFPSKGSKTSLSTEYTGGFLQGDAAFIKYQLTSSWFYPLPLDTVFGVRGRAGYLQPREGKEVPVYERFYLGGINSLRGLRSVGPMDPLTGDVIGGLTMMNFNAEFIFPLIKEAGMKGVLFYDTGNSWVSGYDINDMRKTAGVGVRWYSPVGPLRLEWGRVLDQKKNESPSRWEFTIGMFM